ncbi:nitroreductase family protein [Megasphaera sp.]|uniref:nitroreductase family protein n=1 Tax=Megasphaera TaxID=906 RepID=UPI001D2C2178|nr:nitroreductase family protein [Megasphaera sp.]MBS6790907.1 nitroreductase family protein [Megasphaera sp.]
MDKKVEPALVEKLKEAILLAPSAVNRQPIRAWGIESKEKREQIKAITKYHFQAPLTIAVGYVPDEAWVRQSDGQNHGVVDASIAAM